MKTQHTPGPWEVVEVPHTGLIGVRRGTLVLCLEEDYEGDAHLIAAAPELLTALQSMKALWLSNCNMRGHAASDYAEYLAAAEAIAKATGNAA